MSLTATVTPGATGRVTFYDGSTILGISSISGTQATLATVMLPSGNRSLRAYYAGNATYAPSSSAVVPQNVVAGASLGLKPAVNYPGGFRPTRSATGDFNGDLKQDLVVTDQTGGARIFLGNGDGTFQTALNHFLYALPNSVVVADFNGDTKADLAFVVNGTSVVSG